ncbi:MAG: hypothetical protein JWN64_529 [Parcubacteria group bacterium]|nr:hypothetical protein [Parcubacteria group bacterium]
MRFLTLLAALSMAITVSPAFAATAKQAPAAKPSPKAEAPVLLRGPDGSTAEPKPDHVWLCRQSGGQLVGCRYLPRAEATSRGLTVQQPHPEQRQEERFQDNRPVDVSSSDCYQNNRGYRECQTASVQYGYGSSPQGQAPRYDRIEQANRVVDLLDRVANIGSHRGSYGRSYGSWPTGPRPGDWADACHRDPRLLC